MDVIRVAILAPHMEWSQAIERAFRIKHPQLVGRLRFWHVRGEHHLLGMGNMLLLVHNDWRRGFRGKNSGREHDAVAARLEVLKHDSTVRIQYIDEEYYR